MRRAVADAIAREGAGLSQLEVQAAGDGLLAAQAAIAARSTERHMQALREVLELLTFIEAGGS